MRRCARITISVRQRGVKERELPTFKGLPNLAYFLVEFETKVTESQRLSTLEFVLKVRPGRWWGTHKQSISEWPQCKILLEIRFREETSYTGCKYIGLKNPIKHIEHCCTAWQIYP